MFLVGLQVAFGLGCGAGVDSTDEKFWSHYTAQFEGIEESCLYSVQQDATRFGRLVTEVLEDADRLSAEFDSKHAVLPPNHRFSIRAKKALDDIRRELVKRAEKNCSADKDFDLGGITTRVIVHDVPAAFSFPNGKIYLTTGLMDAELPWSAKNDTELLGVVAHEAVHLVDYHVVAHWTVIRQRRMETLISLPFLLTQLTPFRINYIPLPTGAETYGDRIEFLADSGAVEILLGLGRSPTGYHAFLQRMAGYPHYAAIGKPERRELIAARATCLGLCLAPSGARVRIEKNENLRRLSRHEQFVLCGKTYSTVPWDDWQKIASWLQRPGIQLLNDLPATLGSGRRTLSKMVVAKSKDIDESQRIARGRLGERAQLEAGCPIQ